MDESMWRLGQAYGIMAGTLPKIIGTPAKVTAANMRPVAGLAQGMHLLIANRRMTPAIERAIANALNNVDIEQLPDGVASLDQQGHWINGFYDGLRTGAITEGEYLFQARQMKGFSQDQLAAELGVTASAVSQWERGSRPIPETQKKRLEKLLEIQF